MTSRPIISVLVRAVHACTAVRVTCTSPSLCGRWLSPLHVSPIGSTPLLWFRDSCHLLFCSVSHAPISCDRTHEVPFKLQPQIWALALYKGTAFTSIKGRLHLMNSIHSEGGAGRFLISLWHMWQQALCQSSVAKLLPFHLVAVSGQRWKPVCFSCWPSPSGVSMRLRI